jgi:hypothetical protein
MPPVCGNGIREAGEQCDPRPGTADGECCELDPDGPRCVVKMDRVETECGLPQQLDRCELHAKCRDGECQPVPIPAFPAKRCRNPFETDLCDIGDFCDGQSVSCPEIGKNRCSVTVEDPLPGEKVIRVTCREPTRNTPVTCSAIGRAELSAALVRDHGVAAASECTGDEVTSEIRVTAEQLEDEAFIEQRVKLTITRAGRLSLKRNGTLPVCVLIQITGTGGTPPPPFVRTVTLTKRRKPR